jgi:hypothetical protein
MADQANVPGAGRSVSPARPASTYPAPVLAAAILAAEGVSFLLIGSAALWLHGEPRETRSAPRPGQPGM